jgi:pyruvate dehydrogenase E2 component (dihydrolipoamide acetyltransferase)
MASNVTMPKMGYDMTEGKILRWLKKEGDTVNKGDAVAEIETDKVSIEIEAFAGGVLAKILHGENETVPVGDPIAIIAEPGEKVEAPAASGGAKVAAPAPKQEQGAGEAGEALSERAAERKSAPAAAPAAGTAPQRAAGERVKASPLAKKVAAEKGVDLSTLNGSGPGGRIVRKDVDAAQGGAPAPAAAAQPAAAAAAAPTGGGRREPLSSMRKAIARKMVEAKAPIPHFQVTMAVNMDAAMALRAQINEGLPKEERISVNDMVVKAAAIALTRHPNLNAQFQGDALFYPDYVAISVAVSTPNGLIAPDIHDADKKSIGTIGKEIKEKAGRAREGKLNPDEYGRGTFTVSNLGMYGVEEFNAIITAPQSAAMAVGGSHAVPVVMDGQIVPGQVMKFTVSADHRVTDGAVNAEFCVEVKNLLENPMRLLI